MSDAVLGFLAFASIGSTGIFLGTVFGSRSFPELALATYVIAFAEVVGLTLLLSSFEALTRAGLVAGSALAFSGAVGVWLLAGARRPPVPTRSMFGIVLRRAPVTVLAVVVCGALVYVVALIVGTAPNGWDPLNYHLARAAFWLQSEGVGYIAAAYDERLNFNPPNGEIGVGFALSVIQREEGAGVVQLAAALACAIGVFVLARRFQLAAAEAAFGALLFLAAPIVLLQASTAKNDLVVASFLIAAAVFVLRESLPELAVAGLATALAMGTKFTAAYGLVVLGALALVAEPRTARLRRLGVLAVGTVAGSYWYAVNLAESGHPLGDQSNVPGLTAVLHPPENVVTLFGLLVDAIDLSGGVGADLLLYTVVAVVVTAGLVLGGGADRRSRLMALVAGALVAAPLLLYALTTHVGRPAFVRLYEALGSPTAYLAEGDEVASSPTTASDTASWYGPGGLMLAVGVGVAVVVLVRRGLLPKLTLVAAAAPLAWLALLALSLTYHPWQGRFFVFPIALSASLWGLALRAGSVAWSAVALAATTAVLSLAHFAEKPSGLALLERDSPASVWAMTRSEVQSLHDPTLAPLLMFVDDYVPARATVGLALGANEFGFPVFGPGLERRIELVPFGSSGADIAADWLLANPERAPELDSACWETAFESEQGTAFRRRESCPG